MLNLHPTNPTIDADGNEYETIVINGLMFTILESSAVIVAKSKTGHKSWQGYIVRSPMGAYYLTSSWYNVNTKTEKTSRLQWAEPYPVTIKNVGRANETTLEEQANLEFESMIKKERDKRLSERPLPMLAMKYQDRAKYIDFPNAFAQPKLNGMRMLLDGKIGWSRGGKDIIPECITHLNFELDDPTIILDGELILPNNVLLQETMKAAKKYRKGVSDKLIYCVYDMVDTTGTIPFKNRIATLKSLVIAIDNPQIQFVETVPVCNADDVKAVHKRWTEQKYEGTMIRNAAGLYTINQRSNDLQKYKDMVDSEFKIVEVIEGGGSMAGCAIFVCETDAGYRFNCTPEGTTAIRKEYFANRDQYPGKFLTIRYQELSNDGAPLFPVGVSVRDSEDFQ